MCRWPQCTARLVCCNFVVDVDGRCVDVKRVQFAINESMYAPNRMSPFDFVLGRRTGIAAIDNAAIVPPLPLVPSKDSAGIVVQMTYAAEVTTRVVCLNVVVCGELTGDADASGEASAIVTH